MIVKALAPALNTTPSTPVSTSEMETAVLFEEANVAVSDMSLGMVCGVQLLAVFQSPEPGFAFHVALSA